jgi:Sugar-binding cellulase-like
LDSTTDHLPRRLTITLWDFSWYTRTGPGEPFADLDRACAEAVERGYNTVRICAMPFLLFGSGLGTSTMRFGPLGGGFGHRTRWYDVRATTVLDARQHLSDLFDAAERHGLFIILSSWEFQQSSAFSESPDWHRALMAVPPPERFAALADAWGRLVEEFLSTERRRHRVAYIELHNELPLGHLADVLGPGEDAVTGLQPYAEAALETLQTRYSGLLFAAAYARVPTGKMRGLARNSAVAHTHAYVYGMLDELIDDFALRRPDVPFPQQRARAELLRPEAPDLEDWDVPQAARWKREATIVSQREVYVHDWADPVKWDRWLYHRYGGYRMALEVGLRTQLEVTADWADEHGVPAVIGEGYVGYTPLDARFEEGPIGKELCQLALEWCAGLGFWGAVVTSVAGPHHPLWSDIAFQKELNQRFLSC